MLTSPQTPRKAQWFLIGKSGACQGSQDYCKEHTLYYVRPAAPAQDYLSCYGHPYLSTPNIDGLAARGVRFTRANVQSPICGASRMSTYTWPLHVQSHWRGLEQLFRSKVGEMTMGDYLRPLGMRTALAGKTHMEADVEGMQRLGIDPNSIIGVRVSECGFEPYERDDGLHGMGPDGMRYSPRRPRYNFYLNEKGYAGENPWHDWANAADGEGNQLASGWAMRHARKPARVKEEDSETPYLTRRGMDFIREAGDEPWCLHLSYIKPHWPYIAPAPYNTMYDAKDVIPAMRSEDERRDPHPVYQRVHGSSCQPDILARRCRCGPESDPRLHGADQTDRRPDGGAVPLHGRARLVPSNFHHDLIHRRSRRLSWRSLARRQGISSTSLR